MIATPSHDTQPHGRRRRLRGGRGQSLVEFAVVFPVFILLLAGMVDFGLGLYANVTIINAAREGARLGVTLQPMNTSAIDTRVRSMATGLDQAQLGVTSTCLRPSGSTFVACTSPSWVAGDSVKVNVTYHYSMVWPLAFGTQLDLASAVQMRIE